VQQETIREGQEAGRQGEAHRGSGVSMADATNQVAVVARKKGQVSLQRLQQAQCL
jgi:hypothetical protein